jgi:hypothetical protein
VSEEYLDWYGIPETGPGETIVDVAHLIVEMEGVTAGAAKDMLTEMSKQTKRSYTLAIAVGWATVETKVKWDDTLASDGD